MEHQIVLKLKALTSIWTGDIDGRSYNLRETSIIGSIRWWYESLVRGLGGFACDPTSNDSCIFDENAYAETGNVEDGLRDVCPVCHLFGCTGYSSKFRLMIADRNDDFENIRPRGGDELHFHLIFSRPIADEERWLLAKTFDLISNYGSIGGQTTKKPPKMPDYGLINVFNNLSLPDDVELGDIKVYLRAIIEDSPNIQERLERTPPEYPRLDRFFFQSGYWLDRRKMNRIMKVDRTGFIAGTRGISKKLFSFKERGAERFWGYTNSDGLLDTIMHELTENMGIRGVKTGKEVLDEL